MVESAEEARRVFGGKLGEALALAYGTGAKLFGLRIVDGDARSTYMALGEAYQHLVGRPFDWVVPLVIEAGIDVGRSPDGYPEGFAAQLARFCAANHRLLKPTLGLIQLAPDAPAPQFPPHTGSGPPLESYVAATPMHTRLGEAEEHPLAPLIAASIAGASYNRGLTGLGMEIPGEVFPTFRYESDLICKSKQGLLMLQPTVRRGWSIHKAVTQQIDGPSLTAMRILSEVLWRIRYGLDPYIGEPVDPSVAEDVLEGVLADHPWIEAFDFDLAREGFHGLVVRLSLLIRNEVSRIEVAGHVG